MKNSTIIQTTVLSLKYALTCQDWQLGGTSQLEKHDLNERDKNRISFSIQQKNCSFRAVFLFQSLLETISIAMS
jgi:hypothetical protein